MKETTTKGLFWSWGIGMFRYRWLVLSLWLIIFATSLFFIKDATSLMKGMGTNPTNSEADIGLSKLHEELDFPLSQLQLVFQSDSLDLTEAEQKQKILRAIEPLAELPYILGYQWVDLPRQENSTHIQVISVALDKNDDEIMKVLDTEIRPKIKELNQIQLSITGRAALMIDSQKASKEGMVKAEVIGLPIALIVLLLIFRTLPAALLPLIVALLSVSTTLGISYFIAREIEISTFFPNIVTLLGLAVGVDYALFVISRFREELNKQGSVLTAIGMTSQTTGKSIVFSGIAVMVGLAGMLFIDLSIFSSLAIGGLLVVSLSVAVVNTLLFSLLSILGENINRLRILPNMNKKITKRSLENFWPIISTFVMKNAITIVIITILGLGAFMLPLANLTLATPSEEIVSSKYESRKGYDLFAQTFDERDRKPIIITIENDLEQWEEDSRQKIEQYMERLKGLPGVEKVISTDQFSDSLTSLLVKPKYYLADQETKQVIQQIRELKITGMSTYVTGEAAFNIDMIQRIKDGLPALLIFVFATTYLILFIAFRSVLLPLKAIFMNVLGIGASIGIIVAIVQYGYLAEFFQISSTGYVTPVTLVIIFCVVFGISMDYEVFLISRIAEEYDQNGDNELATTLGLTRTGSLITSAALILIVVVAAFIFTDIDLIKVLGIGLSLAILIDATIIRLLLVPSLMKLMGKANWWAPRLFSLRPSSKELDQIKELS